MAGDFAKIFYVDSDQFLVTCWENIRGELEMRHTIKPPGCDACHLVAVFHDDPETKARARASFEAFDETTARETRAAILEQVALQSKNPASGPASRDLH